MKNGGMWWENGNEGDGWEECVRVYASVEAFLISPDFKLSNGPILDIFAK